MKRYVCSILLLIALAAGSPPVLAQGNLPQQGFADLVERLMPAVVNISTTQKVKIRRMPLFDFGMQFPPGHPFEEFNEFFNQMQPPGGVGREIERKTTSLGSGFIISPTGVVVTNNHVIEGADEITVILSDERKFAAEIIGKDAKTDLAVLQIKDKASFPYVRFGDSDKARVGDWVIAIGNPFGLGGTVTSGIISARARDINAGPFDDFLQTDAAINRGNSGGPMFNMHGEVIGINTAIFSPTGGNVGIGFAVPSALAEPVINQLKEHGYAMRGWLGVRIQEVTDEIAESLGLENGAGALVVDVTPNSPAQRAGLKSGDVILSLGGEPISRMRRLPRLVAETPIGKTLELVVWRDGGRRKLSVTIGKMPEDEEAKDKAVPPSGDEHGGSKVLGMKLAALTPRLREEFGLADDKRGVVVVDVDESSEAAQRGVQYGDLIVRVNEQEIASAGDFTQLVQEAIREGREFVLLRILRQGDVYFVTVPVKS